MTKSYYMIMSSLPRLSPHFKIAQTPISRLSLEKRLKLLPEENVNLLFTLESLVWKSWFIPQQTVGKTRDAYQLVMNQPCEFVRNIATWYLDLRSVIAAIRLRSENKVVPNNPNDYWITRWNYKLNQNWNDPDFGLRYVYPWVPKVMADIANKDSAAVEEILLSYIWNYLSSLESGHHFDFAALIIYLLRWNIIDYWAMFSQENPLGEISNLVNAIIHHKKAHGTMGQGL